MRPAPLRRPRVAAVHFERKAARVMTPTIGDEAMITSTLSFRVAPGKNMEASEYFHTVVRQVKKITGTEVHILTQLGGPMGHFVISGQYETITAWDQMRQKITGDITFQKMVAEAGTAGLFIPGSVTSAIWQQV